MNTHNSPLGPDLDAAPRRALGAGVAAARVALMVDGDNLPATHAGMILEEARRHGQVDLARVYRAASGPKDWSATPGFRMIHAGQGKNGADVLLCIEAVETALKGDFAVFVLASDDGDFAQLAHWLREHGCAVVGIGSEKAPPGFRAACTQFTQLPSSKALSESAVAEPAAVGPALTDLDRKVRAVIAENSEAGKGMLLADLGVEMKNRYGVETSDLPAPRWRTYLTQRRRLYDLDPKGPEAMVRCLPAGSKQEQP